MSYQEIPIDQIDIPDVRVSSILDAEQKQWLEATIKSMGVIQDPIVRRKPGGRYELIAGKSRIQKLQDLGIQKVRVKIVDADDLMSLKMNIIENVARGSWDYISLAKTIKRMFELGATMKDVCETFGRSETWVRRTLILLDLPEEIQTAIQDGRLTPSHVYIAGQLPTPYEVHDALLTAIRLEWNTSILKNYVQNRLYEIEEARKQAQATGQPLNIPKAEPEKLIQYKMCTLCGSMYPSDQVTVQLVCKDDVELVKYIRSILGPGPDAIQTVYHALQLYYSQPRTGIVSGPPPTEESSST